MKSLDPIFSPKSVAVIGATDKEGSVGKTIMWNLMRNPFGGTLYPINPKRNNVLGIKTYPNIKDVPEEVDLAVIVIQARHVPSSIQDCVNAGVKGAIIISAGFKEIGEEGQQLEKEILKIARKGRIRIIGPNCLGVMRPYSGLNATFAADMARPGSVGFISQSGALCTAILDWSFSENVGFSAFISIGSMLDVDWGDLIYYLSEDHRTKSIVIYMETIGNAKSFLSAAREVALTKPIIVIKAGQTEAAAKAAASHTGALAGSDEVLNAAFRRCGVLRVNKIADLFYMADILGKQPRPEGRRLSILTNAGGPGVLATDALINGGGELTTLSDETMEAYDKLLPGPWSHNNPIDILGDAKPERYAKSLEIAANDPNSDGLLVVLTPQAMTDPTGTAEFLRPYAQSTKKPILASWMGESEVEAGRRILNQSNIPVFPYPDTAAQMFNYMWKYSYNLQGIYETPTLPPEFDEILQIRSRADEMISAVRQSGRTLLTEWESKMLLSAYDIPIVETHLALTLKDAVEISDKMGYPVVLKLNSETLTHKTDVGGVQLNLANAEEVKEAFQKIENTVSEKAGAKHFNGVTVQKMIELHGYEIILGSTIDPQFGPVILFGTGGQLVEVFKDRSLALPPLNSTLARRMMEQTKIYNAFKGVRGRKPVDLEELEKLMVHFGQLVVDHPVIKEIDINPLLVSEDRIVALDARVILQDPEVLPVDFPRLAIRPYPTLYISEYKLKDGRSATMRPIRPEDEPLMVKFHESLSENTVYLRYLHQINLSQRVAHTRLVRYCFIDYDREMALVVEVKNPKTREREIIAIGRLTAVYDTKEAEFAIIVSDKYQGHGIGTELLNRLVDVGKKEGVKRIFAEMLPENSGMRKVSEKVGFKLHQNMEENVVIAEMDL
ncbi:MAG: acetyl CoA synthetase subunit alpha [Desulfobacterales bacterium SG8_35_2]|nr:MAG: acetyl CoA synthetase subunit alpha [Desulfobacterales bacterium SG8_35_2]